MLLVEVISSHSKCIRITFMDQYHLTVLLKGKYGSYNFPYGHSNWCHKLHNVQHTYGKAFYFESRVLVTALIPREREHLFMVALVCIKNQIVISQKQRLNCHTNIRFYLLWGHNALNSGRNILSHMGTINCKRRLYQSHQHNASTFNHRREASKNLQGLQVVDQIVTWGNQFTLK